jgi:putative phage-type endonuclease
MQIISTQNEAEWLEERMKDVTSTEVSCLFGISPYSTAFELWHRKKAGVVVRLEQNERMTWGLALQDAIAGAIAKERGWIIARMTEYIRDPEARIGASFDFSIENPDQIGLLEIKNVDGLVFKQEWLEDENGNIQAPLHIEIQVQHQLAVSERAFCYIGALVGGNRLVLINRTRDEAVISAIKAKVAEFWQSIENNTPPAPDFQADAEFIGKLFGYATPGKVLNVVEDADMLAKAKEYKALGDVIKTATEARDAIKAEFLTKIGDAEKVLGEGYTISTGVVGPAHVEYDREGYRMFKISWKNEKKA